MDNTHNFSGLAKSYTAGRPAYADEFIENLYLQHNFNEQSVIADIGSGTGKFAKQLLDRGSFVYGVEPNEDMRRIAVKELGRYSKFCAVDGAAADTGLEGKTADFVTTAQAFHWFDVLQFKKECKRILKKDGKVFLIWNMRDMSNEINMRSFEIYSRYCPKFIGFSGGIVRDDMRIKQFFDGKYKYMEFDNPIFYDKDKFISRSLSSSYSLREGDKNYGAYIEKLSGLFDKYAKNGVITVANKTVAYFGKMD